MPPADDRKKRLKEQCHQKHGKKYGKDIVYYSQLLKIESVVA